MPETAVREPWMNEVDAALKTWRQGDCVVGDQELTFRFDPKQPVSPAAVIAAKEGADDDPAIAAVTVPGLAVITQTCDLASKKVHLRPFVEVAALYAEPSKGRVAWIKKGQENRFAFVPALEDRGLVADLDRTMVIERPVLALWTAQRIRGCRTDEEVRSFQLALMRKHGRPAFPNEFVSLIGPLGSWIKENVAGETPEAAAIANLREIRVRPNPDWNAPNVTVTVYFVREIGAPEVVGGRPWHEWLEDWQRLLETAPASGGSQKFRAEAIVQSLPAMTAAEYVLSDRLDVDHLS